MAAALGWLATCASFYFAERRATLRLIATSGALVSLLLVLMKLLPMIPGHFSRSEWVALAAWVLLGIIFHRGRQTSARRRPPSPPQFGSNP
jgi:hypothetical protein